MAGNPIEYLYSEDTRYAGPVPTMYRWHALSFLKCAEYSIAGYRQAHNSDPSPQQSVPIVYLICHAIEMLLKLALYKTGSNDRDLRTSRVRHNLSELKEKCEIAGVQFSPDVAEMIEALSTLHADHSLRYAAFENGPYWLPYNPEEMIALARCLITAAHPSQTS